jgi:DNA-binding NtrC family response regulator
MAAGDFPDARSGNASLSCHRHVIFRESLMETARLLIVDDKPEILNLVSRVLRDRYEVFSASSPRNALEIVKTKPLIDLVLSDVEMPEMRGPELINEVIEISPSTAVMLMSGNEEIQTDLPANILFLRKPFSSQELHASVEAALAVAGNAALIEQHARLNCELNEGIFKSAKICEESHVIRNLLPKTDAASSGSQNPIVLVDDHPVL